jgi:hypothetical protein
VGSSDDGVRELSACVHQATAAPVPCRLRLSPGTSHQTIDGILVNFIPGFFDSGKQFVFILESRGFELSFDDRQDRLDGNKSKPLDLIVIKKVRRWARFFV